MDHGEEEEHGQEPNGTVGRVPKAGNRVFDEGNNGW